MERGDAKLEDGKTLRDYITAYAHRSKSAQLEKVHDALGVDVDLLGELMGLDLNENNLNEFKRFDRLQATVDKAKAKAYFESIEGVSVSPFRVNMKAAGLLRRFVLEGGFDLKEG